MSDALYTTKGEGLGLSICRKCPCRSLWVEKNTSYGATFAFALPRRQSVQLSERN
jgi:signal transduction histidine kinase